MGSGEPMKTEESGKVLCVKEVVNMTRSEMIEFLKKNPYVNISHFLFAEDEFIYSDTSGLVYDENGRIFENWDSITDMWSGVNGIRLRTGGNWETGWYTKK